MLKTMKLFIERLFGLKEWSTEVIEGSEVKIQSTFTPKEYIEVESIN